MSGRVKTVPNCAKCKWLDDEKYTKPMCVAIGYKMTMDCYNTRQCKKVYQEKEV